MVSGSFNYIVQFLNHSGRHSWAKEIETLVAGYFEEIENNRRLHDDLAEMHKLYQDLKNERGRTTNV